MIAIPVKSKHGDKYFFIDSCDLEKVMQHKWHLAKNHNNFYIMTDIKKNGKKSCLKIHRFILNCPDNKVVDHINGNCLDNTRQNLRICSRSENSMNRKKNINNKTSVFKGVNFHHNSGKYVSRIGVNNKRIHLGYFSKQEDAAAAYNEAALKYHGEFASLN